MNTTPGGGSSYARGGWLVLFVLFWGIFVMAVRLPLDSDLWWHLRAGQDILAQRHIATTDSYSHTRLGAAWVDHGWLGQVVLAAAYGVGGYRALSVLSALIITAATAFVYLQTRGGLWVRVLTTLLGAVVSSVVWAPRPQLLSLLFTAVLAWLLSDYRERGPSRLWLVPVLMVVWANSHAGFAAGFVLLGLYLACETFTLLSTPASTRKPVLARLRWLVLATAGAVAVIPLNPNGATLYTYAFRTAGIGTLQTYIQEWASPDFHEVSQQPFIWMLLLILASMAISRSATLVELGVVAVFAYMALLAGRNIGLFAVVAAGPLSRSLTGALKTWHLGRKPGQTARRWATRELPRRFTAALNGAIVLLLLAGGAVKAEYTLSSEAYSRHESRLFPKAAVDRLLSAHLPGELYNSYNWGGYIIWRAFPDYRVFVDGRTDLFGDALLSEYLSVYQAEEGWPAILDAHGVNTVLVESKATIARVLGCSAGWRQVYADAQAVLFVRD